MVDIEKTDGGRVTYRALGEQLSPGDRIDVSEAFAAHYCDERGEFERVEDDGDESDTDLAALDGVGDARAEDLREAGYETLGALADASVEELAAVDGVSESLAESIHEQVRE